MSLNVTLSYMGYLLDIDYVLFDDHVQWLTTPPDQAAIDSAELPAAKADRIETDRQECKRRLFEFYGDGGEQVSRATGIYGETARSNHANGVAATIDASNVARDQINVATTVEEVEAVTVDWPELT
jgi:hypothetical protein